MKKMLYDYVLQGGTLVYPEKTREAAVGIKNGRLYILKSSKRPQGKTFVDASGCFILPGLIDAHTHPVYVDNLEQIARPAAFGGVTSMIHYITVKAGQKPLSVLEKAIAQGERTSALDFGLHAALCDVPGQAEDIPALIARGVSSFKMFTAYKKLNMMTDDHALALGMDIIGKHGGIASVHAENGSVIDYLEERVRVQGKSMAAHFLQTSPSLLDKEAIFRVLCIGGLMHCPVYLPHISSRHALEALTLARRHGIRFYSETCPHYLVFSWAQLKKYGPLGKIRPPVKTAQDRDELWRALSGGVIHTIGSDHAPKDKHRDDAFDESPYGAPGIENILPVLWHHGVGTGRISPGTLVRLTAENPAKIFGLFPRKGRLQNGADADLVVFNPRHTWTVTRTGQHSNAPYTLYEGMKLGGKVEKVFSGGRLIVDDKTYHGESGTGRFLQTGISGRPL